MGIWTQYAASEEAAVIPDASEKIEVVQEWFIKIQKFFENFTIILIGQIQTTDFFRLNLSICEELG